MRGPILAVIAMLSLSGCFGLPPGAADYGDQVGLEGLLVDADGTVVGGFGNLTVVVGQDPPGSVTVEGDLLGKQAGDAVSGSWSGTGTAQRIPVDASFGPFELSSSLPRGVIENAFGTVRVGQSLPGAILQIYNATVTQITNNTIEVEAEFDDLHAIPAPDMAAEIVPREGDDGTFFLDLEMEVPSVFVVSPAQSNILGLPNGGFFVPELADGQYLLLYRDDVTPSNAGSVVYVQDGFSGEANFDGEIHQVTQAKDEIPTGEYGKRRSPVLKDPEALSRHLNEDHGDAMEDHAGDGHGDHTH